jgi:hypothetical protein
VAGGSTSSPSRSASAARGPRAARRSNSRIVTGVLAASASRPAVAGDGPDRPRSGVTTLSGPASPLSDARALGRSRSRVGDQARRSSGGSSRSCTMRMSEVLPAPHGALTPIVSGGRVSSCRMKAAIASAYCPYPSVSSAVQ